jgi:hypothetical protein
MLLQDYQIINIQKQVGIKKPDYVLEKFNELFDDILFSSWDITLEYDMNLDAIIIYIDGKKAGFIEPDIYPIWYLFNKNYDKVDSIAIYNFHQTYSHLYILLNYIQKCIQRIEIEELLCR